MADWNSTTDESRGAVGQAAAAVKNVADKAAETLKESADAVRQKAEDVGRRVRDAAGQAYDKAGEQVHRSYEWTREHAREAGRGVDSYVRHKPMQAVLIAAGVGALLGVLWKRR